MHHRCWATLWRTLTDIRSRSLLENMFSISLKALSEMFRYHSEESESGWPTVTLCSLFLASLSLCWGYLLVSPNLPVNPWISFQCLHRNRADLPTTAHATVQREQHKMQFVRNQEHCQGFPQVHKSFLSCSCARPISADSYLFHMSEKIFGTTTRHCKHHLPRVVL